MKKPNCCEIAASLVFAGFFCACGQQHMDRLRLPYPSTSANVFVPLVPITLSTDADYDQLDKWVLRSGSLMDIAKFYDDLLRLAPEDVKTHVRVALALMAVDEERGTVVGRQVLERFAGSGHPDLEILRRRLGETVGN